MAVGSVFGGKFMVVGRRRAIMLTAVLGIIGNLMTLKLNFALLLIGRVVYGLSVGIQSAIVPRYIEENTPSHIYDSVSALFCLF